MPATSTCFIELQVVEVGLCRRTTPQRLQARGQGVQDDDTSDAPCPLTFAHIRDHHHGLDPLLAEVEPPLYLADEQRFTRNERPEGTWIVVVHRSALSSASSTT